ncbi:ABC-2 type transport system permease protein [Geodermatophilus normandii]|uniref:Transport permease protein n=1 Tax=Geodermatophilus normandii TaxID=1137989 RepID=A0A317QNN8_9ACTN|nr:ABC transporter permease [Geodermatophilus normandii]PWW24331.1 ABC-2 type transport system permease protein [Geodermatophilus normandii]
MTVATVPVARHSGPRATLSDQLVMTGRCVRLTRRNVDTLVMAILLPLLQMALFVYVFGGAISNRAAYVDYVVPGIVLLCAGYGATSTAMSVAADTTSGMVDRLRSMPIRSSAVLTGHVVASVARNAVSTAVVVAAAVLMGFRSDAGPLEWLAAAAVVLLYVLALSWLAAFLGVLARSVESASALSFVMLFLPYLSSAFVPPETLPTPLRAVAEHQPITPVIETVRGLLTGTPVGASGWTAVLWCTGVLVAAVTAAGWAYRRRGRS